MAWQHINGILAAEMASDINQHEQHRRARRVAPGDVTNVAKPKRKSAAAKINQSGGNLVARHPLNSR